MTTRVDIEEIESTRSERFLAVVLLAFLLIGTIWFYVKIDDWAGGRQDHAYTAREQKIFDAQTAASAADERAQRALTREESDVRLAKDALDIALAKGEPTAALEDAYNEQRAEFIAAQDRAAATAQRSSAAEARVVEMEKRRADRPADGRTWLVAGLRLAFILGWFAASLRLLTLMRRRQSRFLPLGFAAVASAVVTAVVFATDYILDYIDPLDLGPIVLSVAGAAATIGTFIGLQRWLARRIPGRRVRNGECPFCGHPVRDTPHCEGCGREVIAPCAACGQPRRVGSPHCGACGQA